MTWALAAFFILAGLNHFRVPAFYEALIPALFPWHHALNLISGAAEIAGGLGLLIPRFRRAAGWGLILLLIAVFPANIDAALKGHMAGTHFGPAVLWARLPLQFVLGAAVWWSARLGSQPVP